MEAASSIMELGTEMQIGEVYQRDLLALRISTLQQTAIIVVQKYLHDFAATYNPLAQCIGSSGRDKA